MRRMRYFIWTFSAAVILGGCTKEHEAPTASNPLDTGRVPPTPKIESVIVGNRRVTLTWTVDDTSAISKYNIFRSDSADADYRLVGSSSIRTYTDRGLVNGKRYFYKVASVDTSGLEGYKSEYVSAVPNIFSVTINGGMEFTNSRSVVLTFSVGPVPQDQTAEWWIKVSNDPSFEGATWEPLPTMKQWQLTPGDGEKVVYVKFQDSEGNESSTVSDRIILDTVAYIESFSFQAESSVLEPGDVVHFRLKAGETGGRATVDIGDVKVGIPLRDDGTEGDSEPGDGVYERDFTIEPGMEITDGIITANFEDRVGNVALPVTAPGRITIREPSRPPEPVVLNIPVPVAGSTTSLSLSWSQSREEDFASYRLFRSEEPGVDSTSTLVATITDKNTTSYEDTGLEEGKTYYYKIYVYDSSGLCAGSNEVSGSTKANEPPEPVVLNIPVPVAGSPTSLSLSWSQSKEEDFASYRLFRSEEPGVDSTSTLVATITDKNTTSYEDTGLEEGKTYYYRIYVYDASGLCAGSNEVSGSTKANEPPEPVVLNIPVPVAGSTTSLSLSWSQSREDDFASYRLFRSEEPGVDSTSTLVATITDKATTSYEDTGLEEGKTYYYRIYVYDASGLCAGSNEVSGSTKANEPPEPVVLNTPVAVAGSPTSLSLSWSQSKEEDFASYRIFRSEEPGVDSTSTLVATITDKNTTSYEDTGLEEGKTYYYRIYVYDASGLCAGSNEVSGSTKANEPPEPVVLNIPVPVAGSTTSLSLSWSQSKEEDFASYRLFRSEEPGVDSTSTLVATITDKATTSYEDTGLEEGKTYYYRIYVYDASGLCAGSNEVSGSTEANEPPEPVVLNTPVPVAGSTTSLSLSWSQSKEEDFASYRLFRSEEPGVDSTSTLVATITDKNTTSYEDTGLEEGKTYYYKIYVYDSSGLCAGSNEVSGSTEANEPPEPVVLNIPVPVAGSTTSLSLSWSQSKEEDFASYRLFRSEEPGVDSTSTLVATITDKNTTSYEDTGLEEGKTYYYRIYVYDSSGLCSGSNEVSGSTEANEPPEPVVLNTPVPVAGSTTSLSLSWSQSKEEDFASYRLFRSEEPGVDSTSTLVTTITDKATTSYEDTGLEEGKTYYYRIYVYDSSGLCAGSNEVSGSTKANEPPEPVVLNIPVPVAGSTTSLSLSWSQSREEDFASYRLFRSEEPGVDSTSTLVTTITDKATTSYEDTGLEEGKTYYYRIYVYDSSGLCAGSNEVSGSTKANEPPEPVVLNIPVPVAGSTTSLSLSWSQSREEDFASYRIFRSEEPGVDSTSTLVATITDKNTTSYEDTGLEEGKTYYYRIYVYDASGLCAGSNEVSGSTKANEPPEPVVLSTPFNPTTSSLQLSWTQSHEEDFAYYKIFRSKESTVSDTSTLITTITSKTNTSYTDTGLEENTVYYYVVYVYDTEGLRTASNIVQGRTKDEPPAPVTLYSPSSISSTGMTITWSESDATDFFAYKLYRSESPGVNTSDELVATISSKEITFYDDEGLQENTSYYYRIYVFDKGGNFSRSNEVSATTENEEPSAVWLKPVAVLSDTSLRVTWTESREHDFSSYKIYRSTSLPVDLSSTLVRTVEDPEDTVYIDTGLQENTKYYYRVYVLDTGGLSKGSNVQSATTMNGRPSPVTLSVVKEDSNSVTLSWSRSTEEDFAYYKLFRSEGPGVTTSSTLVATIQSDAAVSFEDRSVKSGKTYYYRVFVFDEGGLYSGSNEVTATPE